MAGAVKGKKIGKENAPPKSKVIEEDADTSIGDMSIVEETTQIKSTERASSKAPSKSKKAAEEDTEEERPVERQSSSNPSKKIVLLTSENDRLRKQRDTYSKQFDELSRLRSTDSEKLFDKYKQNVEVQTKAQNEIIETMTKLNEKQSSRIAALEKSLAAAQKAAEAAAAAPAPVLLAQPEPAPAPIASTSTSTLGKSDLKELKALREEVTGLRKGVKEKDQKITQLEKEYKAEVEQSRTLQASTRTAPNLSASTSIPPLTEEAEKDAICLSLYEDMTELQILNVKLKRDAKSGKEATLNCLHTSHEQKRSLHFKLRTYQELSPELVAQKAENPWVRMIHYQPENLAMETDKEFVSRLEAFGDEFTIERKQLGEMWEQLRAKVAGEDDEDEE